MRWWPQRVALFDMPAEGGGAARLDRGHDAPLGGRQRRAGLLHDRRRRSGGRCPPLRASGDPRARALRSAQGAEAGGSGVTGHGSQVEGTRRRTHLDRGNPEIARGGRETAMAEQQLNGADVGAGFEEMDGKCVTQANAE